MTDVRDAHFLHEQKGLSPVLSPPVEDVRTIAWIPGRNELLLANGDGMLACFDPVMGMRTLLDDLGEAGAMAVAPEGDLVAFFIRGEGLEVRAVSNGELRFKLPLSLVGDLWLGFWKDGLYVTGKGLEGPMLYLINREGQIRARGKLPPGASVGTGRNGGLLMGRVTAEGVEVVKLGVAMGRKKPTGHRLRFNEQGILYGTVDGGVTVWPGREHEAITVRSFGVTSAAVSQDMQWAALGLRDGCVALASIAADSPDRGQPHKCGGHDEPVHAVVFSSKGKWMASAGYECWVWQW